MADHPPGTTPEGAALVPIPDGLHDALPAEARRPAPGGAPAGDHETVLSGVPVDDLDPTIRPRRSPNPGDAERRELADRITEDVLQLLFTTHQDLAEMRDRGPTIDPELLQSAMECSLGAIAMLRVVASTVLDAAWGEPPGDVQRGPWAQKAPLLFDAMSDAWVITCEDRDLLFASDRACTLLQRSSAELTVLMRDKAGWPARITALARAAGAEPRGGDGEGTAVSTFDVDVPRPDGSVVALRVESHALPLVTDVQPSYISLLTERDA